VFEDEKRSFDYENENLFLVMKDENRFWRALRKNGFF
jgi:hypothetical protein